MIKPGVRTLVGWLALGGLLAVATVLADPGRAVVQAAGRGGDPGWILGLFGEGRGIAASEYLDWERIAFVLYIVACLCASAVNPRALKVVVALLIAAFTLAPPLLSLDVFSYISYARLEALHDLNPYRHAPSEVPADQALTFIERWRDTTSAYGPLFTLITLPAGHLGVSAALWSIKALTGASALALVLLVGRLAPARGLDPRPAIALVGLNPLFLVHGVGGPHNDVLMVLFVTAGVAAVLSRRELAGGAALIGAAAIKVSAGFAAPFALIGASRRGRLAAGGIAAAALIAVASLAVFGGGLLDSLKLAGENQDLTSRHSVPVTIAHDFGVSVEAARLIALAAYGAALAWLLRWTWRGGDWVRAAGWAALGLLFATSYLAPWYTIWALPLAAISRDRALVLGVVAFTAFELVHQVAL